MDDSFESNALPSSRPSQHLSSLGKVSQVVVDSDDDISSGANESSDEEQKVSGNKTTRANGLRKIPLPGQKPLKKLKSAFHPKENGINSHAQNVKLKQNEKAVSFKSPNVGATEQSFSGSWANFNMANPWASSAVPEPQNSFSGISKDGKTKVEENKYSDGVEIRNTKGAPGDPMLENSQKSIENPMLWEDNSNRNQENEADVDQILKDWEDRDAQEHQTDSIQDAPDIFTKDDQLDIDFSTPPRNKDK